MKVTLNFTVNVCVDDDNRKYEINSDNEKIVQLLNLLADLGVSNLQKQSCKNITVKELLDLYASAKMLKNNSVLSIYLAFKQLIRHDNYLNMDISELSPSMIITDCNSSSMNTKHHYLAQMSAVLNFAVKKGYLSVNFLKNFREEYGIYKKRISMRKAFSCENWILIDDAVSVLKPFFSAIHDCFFRYLHYSSISLYYLMLLHMILGTRISDTLVGVNEVCNYFKDKCSIVVWENEYFGKIERNGKQFTDFPVYKNNADQITHVLKLEHLHEMFANDLKRMNEMHLTFDDANQSKDFTFMQKNRLNIIKNKLFEQCNQLI